MITSRQKVLPRGTAVGTVEPDPAPQDICLLCSRRFASVEQRLRHERQSELHSQNLEQQRSLVEKHKQEVLNTILALRQQLHKLGAAGASLTDCQALETKLRQLLGEFAQAQEMLEYGRLQLNNGGPPGSSCPGEGQPRRCELRVGGLVLELGAACWQGGKEVQEDRYVLNISLRSADGRDVVGFAVLDGHSGSRCVDQLVERLPVHLQACLASQAGLSEESLRRAVAEACAATDQEFLARARQEELMDGSTMILGLVFPDDSAKSLRPPGSCRLLMSNIGDSRAVLCRAAADGRLSALRLSADHKPDRPDERQRIEARGGIVDFHGAWRVLVPSQVAFGGRRLARWGLAVSRSFGDLLLKEPERFGCGQVAPGGLVVAEPEQHAVDLDPDSDRFLVLASDGVWDVLRDEDATAVCASQAGPELAAYTLVRHAFAAGSGDNLTALAVCWHKANP